MARDVAPPFTLPSPARVPTTGYPWTLAPWPRTPAYGQLEPLQVWLSLDTGPLEHVGAGPLAGSSSRGWPGSRTGDRPATLALATYREGMGELEHADGVALQG